MDRSIRETRMNPVLAQQIRERKQQQREFEIEQQHKEFLANRAKALAAEREAREKAKADRKPVTREEAIRCGLIKPNRHPEIVALDKARRGVTE